MESTRRDFLNLGAAAGAAAALHGCAAASAQKPSPAPLAARCADGKPVYYAFSRVFQFLDWDRACDLLARCGYTGVEWTVRPKGHVEPERVRTDLPKALKAAAAHGLKAEMIVVEFLDPAAPQAMDILKTAADCGVKAFRPAYFRYDCAASAPDALEKIRAGLRKLEAAARAAGLKCQYQNHSTYSPKVPLFGSAVWDLWELIRDFDPAWFGVQYDVMHAQAEMAPSWQHVFGMIAPWISTLCLKDFWFEPLKDNPKMWRRRLCPAGEGIVPWRRFRDLCVQYGVSAPFSVHYDYEFPSDEKGAEKFAKHDVEFFKSVFG